MRLIDADKLLEPGYTNMFDEPIRFTMLSRYAIENAPTVKAIPIEFLDKWFGNNYNAFTDLMMAWEKENEHKESD